MDSLFSYPTERRNLASMTSIKAWEEEFQKGFENVFDSKKIFVSKDEEINYSNDIEKFYFINEGSSLLDSAEKFLKDIEEKIEYSINLSDIDTAKILIELDNIYEQNKNKQLKIKILLMQKKLLDLLKQRTIQKIENAKKTFKNSSTGNSGNSYGNDL